MPTLLSSRRTFTGRNPADVGAIAHVLIATHVPLVNAESGSGGLERMYAVAYALIEANPNRTRVVATEAAGLALRYLNKFPPALPWRLLGPEYDTGNGRVDLAWVNDTTGQVFFDEVKTSRVSNGRRVPATWVDQARRYSAAGSARFGDLFAGTRLVPLMSADTTRLVRNLRPLTTLSPTAADPFRPLALTPVRPSAHPSAGTGTPQ